MAQHPTTAPDSSSSTLFVDDFYLSVLLIQPQDQPTGDFQVMDSMYAEELQLQEALMAAAQAVSNRSAQETSPSTADIGSSSGPGAGGAEDDYDVAIEEGKTTENFCQICAEMRGSEEMFRSVKCSHAFCSYCISKHVAVKIQENTRVVTCPGLNCKRVLEVDECRGIVAREVLERWDEVMCESLIAASERFYCPFKDCSAMMVNDNGGEVIRESECPACLRLFCAACYVPWHSGRRCEEFQMKRMRKRGRTGCCRSSRRRRNGGDAHSASSTWRRLSAVYTSPAGVNTNFAMDVEKSGLNTIAAKYGDEEGIEED